MPDLELRCCRCTAVTAALILAILLAAAAAPAQVSEPAEGSDEVPLRADMVRLPPGIGPGLEALRAQRAAGSADREQPRLIVDFESLPDAELLGHLAAQGIRLGNYLGGNAYIAMIDDQGIATLEAAAENRERIPGLRAAAPVPPEYKQEESVRRGTIGSWAVREDGTVLLRVEVWRDANFESVAAAVEDVAEEILERAPAFDWLMARIRPEQVEDLTRLNGVSWVEPVPPPFQTFNDQSRLQLQVNEIQAAPYNLSGQGINVGVWDGTATPQDPTAGTGIELHGDFQGRLTNIEPVDPVLGPNRHATHVAGTLAGSGVRSQPSGGAANQWRGMATRAQILYWDFSDNVPNEYLNGIQNRGIQLANNSWGYTIEQAPSNNCNLYGDYDGLARDFDRIVHGDIGGRAIPVIFGAGNERADGDCGMSSAPPYNNYRVIPPPGTAKNVITVGAINSDDLTMTDFSSWGPVEDGRLKPEVVAPGCQVSGDNGINSTNLTNNYQVMCGTSMAAPAVSGIVSLLLQQHQAIYGVMPIPAVLKALLIHTALDLGRPGPDYAFGYGVVDALGAVEAIRSQEVFSNTIAPNEQRNFFRFDVRSGTPEIKVTLAWDDQAAPPPNPANAPTLINDLDLSLIAPGGQVHRPFLFSTPVRLGTTLTAA